MEKNKRSNEEKEGINERLVKDPKKNSLIITFAFSLLAATLMWLVAVDEDYEKTFTNINIALSGETEFYVELDDKVKLEVTARGKRKLLSTLDSSDFVAWVDVSEIKKEGKSDLLPVVIEPINGITIQSQTLTHATVIAEKRVPATFEIFPLLGVAQLEDGVEYSLICDTETVTVTGSESLIKKIKRAVVYVDPEPKNVTESFNSRCEIVLEEIESYGDIDTSSLKISPQYCGVKVSLSKEKSVPIKIVLDGGPQLEYGASFKPEVTNVVITGEPKIINTVNNLELVIPYEKITNQFGSGKESFDVSGTVIYPEGVKSESGIEKINVNVSISEKAETVLGEDVVITGCPLEYTVNVSQVEIQLLGLYEVMETIKSTDIFIKVDLSNTVPSASEQKVKGVVSIENAYGTSYVKECLVTVVFLKR